MAIPLCHLLGLAGCLAQHCTPGWGVPVELRPPLLGPGDQALDITGRRLAGRSYVALPGRKRRKDYTHFEKRASWASPVPRLFFLPFSPDLLWKKKKHDHAQAFLGREEPIGT